MTKKEYQKPSSEVVVLNQQQQLLAGSVSPSASFDDYGDGGTVSWD